MTGVDPRSQSSRRNFLPAGALGNHVAEPLPVSIPVFTGLLHAAGYEVAICGKAYLGNGLQERYRDYYFALNSPAANYHHPTAPAATSTSTMACPFRSPTASTTT